MPVAIARLRPSVRPSVRPFIHLPPKYFNRLSESASLACDARGTATEFNFLESPYSRHLLNGRTAAGAG